MSGYVYLIGNKKFGWYKIGKSINPDVRVNDLGILLPFQIRIFAIWKAENHTMMEATLHEKCKDCRINGEWFSFDTKQLNKLLNDIPKDAYVYSYITDKDHVKYTSFSNIEEDTKHGQRITSVKKRKKLTTDLSDTERERRRLIAIQEQQLKKLMKEAQLPLF